MSKEELLCLEGAMEVKPDQNYTGVIRSSELIEKFDKRWIPNYQRVRVPSKKKINSLIEIFKSNSPLEAIVLGIQGSYDHDRRKSAAVFEGRVSVIDGQQRLWALVDSGVENILVKVDIHLNIEPEKEIALFHQLNKDGTDLTFGELAKSVPGSFADLVRLYLKKKDLLPFHLLVNGNNGGMSLSMFCPIIYLTHKKVILNTLYASSPSGKRSMNFLSENHPDKDVAMVQFAVKNMMEAYVEHFGAYNNKADAYKRSFFLAWNRLIINQFLTPEGKVEYGKFKQKMMEAPVKIMNDAMTKQVLRTGGDQAIMLIYDLIVEHLNHKLALDSGRRLPLLNQIGFVEDSFTYKKAHKNESNVLERNVNIVNRG